MNKKEQGNFIKTKRLEKGFTRKDFAEKIGLSCNEICNIEGGLYWGSSETLYLIEKNLDLEHGTLYRKPFHLGRLFDPTGLKRLREKCGLTQKQLATALGLTRNDICNIERGRKSLKHLIPDIRTFLSKKLKEVHAQSIFKSRSYPKIKEAINLIRNIEIKSYFLEA